MMGYASHLSLHAVVKAGKHFAKDLIQLPSSVKSPFDFGGL